MTELETALREALRHRAGDPSGWSMPAGTRRRIRRRQLITGVAGTTVAVAAVLISTVFLVGLRGGDRQDTVGGSSSAPYGSLPPTWPTIVAGDPADAGVLPAARILYSGTVADADFAFAGYLVDDGVDGPGPCLDFAGPSTPTEQGPTVGVCANAPVGDPVPTGADLDLAGAGSSAIPDIEANFGFVSARVAALRVELSDGSTAHVPILPAPAGWVGIRPFLFFPPADVSGTVVALSEDGTELASAPMCVHEVDSNSCHVRVDQIAPIGVIWPEVRPDADGTPYIDREEDERVVGEKIPILHGEVTTPFTGGPVAFSLVVWQSAGGFFEAGEWADLFEGYRLSEDGSTISSDAVGGGSKERVSELSGKLSRQPVVLFVASHREGDNGERLFTLAGAVAPGVAKLELRAGGEVRDVALVDDPMTDGHRLFVAFPALTPEGVVSGTLVALDSEGSEIWSSEILRLLPPTVEVGPDDGSPQSGSG